jgi:hypothetical protein
MHYNGLTLQAQRRHWLLRDDRRILSFFCFFISVVLIYWFSYFACVKVWLGVWTKGTSGIVMRTFRYSFLILLFHETHHCTIPADTPSLWNTVLLQELKMSEIVKEIHNFYETPGFIIVFTRAKWIQFTCLQPICSRSVLILSYHLSLIHEMLLLIRFTDCSDSES